MSDELPANPFSTGLGAHWDTLADAARLWAALEEMEDAGDVLKAISGLDRSDLARMVFERIACTRLRFEISGDGVVEWERRDE